MKSSSRLKESPTFYPFERKLKTMVMIFSKLRYSYVSFFIFCVIGSCHSLSHQEPTHTRREALVQATSICAAGMVTVGANSVEKASAAGADLNFQTTSSGIQWADAKVGTGNPLQKGGTATIDYVMSTTGARYGTKIYSTADLDTPYRWKLGDGSTIEGLEQAILGDGASLAPMRPGGIRRLVIPQSLGYTKLAANSKTLCVENGAPGPIPPPTQAFENYQRFKNIYCNSDRQYQPDIVMDIKLYGQR